ncbi:hypothetical protein C4553_01110 [Candidatus Parcubacteria bacterium]|nr:MAG: hypothetical protein C4553_01110 [Candidatus Parcubacteria bacterium]
MELSDKQALEALAKRDKTTLSNLVSELVINGLKQKISDVESSKIQTDVNKRLDDISENIKWVKAWSMTQKAQLEKRHETISNEFELNYRNL